MYTAEQIELALAQPTLTLGSLSGYSQKQLREWVVENFTAPAEALKSAHFLIAYECYEDYSADAYFLFIMNGKLHELHGGHCSCHGYEDQWSPEETTYEYLRSPQWAFNPGGSDTNGVAVKEQADAFIEQWFKKVLPYAD